MRFLLYLEIKRYYVLLGRQEPSQYICKTIFNIPGAIISYYKFESSKRSMLPDLPNIRSYNIEFAIFTFIETY